VFARSKRALAEYDLEGVVTIVPFHRLMLDDERFVAGTHTTKYLDEELDEALVADAQEKWGTESSASGDDDEEVSEREFTVEVNGKRFEVELEERGAPAIPVPEGGMGGAGGSGGEQRPRRRSPTTGVTTVSTSLRAARRSRRRCRGRSSVDVDDGATRSPPATWSVCSKR